MIANKIINILYLLISHIIGEKPHITHERRREDERDEYFRVKDEKTNF
jgi:hypothetical protein